MSTRGNLSPIPDVPIVVRSQDVIKIADGIVFDNVLTTWLSARYFVGAYRYFLLFIDLTSSGSPTTLQVQVQFSHDESGKPYTYNQGLFSSLMWEDVDTASGIQECFRGDVAGREISIRAIATGTTGVATFTLSTSVEFYA